LRLEGHAGREHLREQYEAFERLGELAKIGLPLQRVGELQIRSSVCGSTTPATMLLCFSMTWSSVSGLRGSPLACVVSAASVQGFSLHANTQVPAHRRDQLERLIRYTARGAVSLERLTQDAHGELVYTFTHPWSDGTTGIRLSPLELLEKLAALVPLPRMHLVRYGECLAPYSHLRGAIIPTPSQQGMADEEPDTGSPRWSWARLLKQVFALDMARCPFCQQGTLRIIAAITQGEAIRTILQPLKLAVTPPPIAPARVRQDAFARSSA